VDFACNASTQLPEVHIWVHRPAAEDILDLISSTLRRFNSRYFSNYCCTITHLL